jgi:hypothetical protein
MKLKWFALASAMALASAAPAFATVYVSNIGVLDGTTVNIQAPGLNENAYASPQVLTELGKIDPSILFFCLNIYGVDYLGDQVPPQAFEDGVLTTDYNGHNLSTDQIGHTKYLASQAKGLWDAHDNLGLEAMQLSFWIIDGGATINYLGNTALENRTLSFINDPGRIAGPLTTMDAVITTTQSGLGVPLGVPEPASWALMITGFLGAGMALRHRRRQLALA